MSNADIVDGISSISSSFQIWGAVFVGALIIFCLGICVYRAKSINFLLDRIWIFFGGKLEFNDKELNNDWDIVRDLELFRYRYGFDVETKDHVKSLKNWLSSNNINFLELRKISNLFDVKAGRIRKSSFTSDIVVNGVLILCLAISIIFTNFYLNKDKAEFVVVETEKNFSFDGKRLYIYDEKFSRRQCDVITTGRYPDPEDGGDNIIFNKYVACGIFSVEGKKFYEKTLEKAATICWVIILPCSLMILILGWQIRKYLTASKINRKIEEYNQCKRSRNQYDLDIE